MIDMGGVVDYSCIAPGIKCEITEILKVLYQCKEELSSYPECSIKGLVLIARW